MCVAVPPHPGGNRVLQTSERRVVGAQSRAGAFESTSLCCPLHHHLLCGVPQVKVYFPFIRLLCTGLDKIPCYAKSSAYVCSGTVKLAWLSPFSADVPPHCCSKTYLYRGMPATEEIILTYLPGKSFQWCVRMCVCLCCCRLFGVALRQGNVCISGGTFCRRRRNAMLRLNSPKGALWFYFHRA